MPKGWRDWRVVLHALRLCGADTYGEDEKYVYLARFPHVGQMLRKWWVPKEYEQHLLEHLRIDPYVYAETLRSIEGLERGEFPGGAANTLDAAAHEEAHKKCVALCLAHVRQMVKDAATSGLTVFEVTVPEGTAVLAIIREARVRRDELHLAVEHEVHAIMQEHPSLQRVVFSIPSSRASTSPASTPRAGASRGGP